MARCRAVLTALTCLLLCVAVAAPAQAGGPTSVLLVAPESGRTAALYVDDADYEALGRLVGAFQQGVPDSTVDPTDTSHESGRRITVTWLIHDVQVWRVDRVYVGADDGPWIATQGSLAEPGGIWDTPVTWHQAADGPALTSLLDRLGVGAVAGSAAVPDKTGAQDNVAAQQTVAAQTETAQTGSQNRPGWIWGLAGLALGVLAAIGMSRAMSSLTSASRDGDAAISAGSDRVDRGADVGAR